MRLAAFIAALLALLALLFWQFPYAIKNSDDAMRLLYLVVLLAGVAGMRLRRSLDWNQQLRYLTAWVLIAIALVAVYSYRDVLLNNRVVAELLPNRPRYHSGGSVSVRAGENGHFHIEAKVDGAVVNFLIDTGASDITLNRRDAARAGLNPDTLAYTHPYLTANGVISGALVRLRSLDVGPFHLENMPASVNQGELDESLLGMRFLETIGSVHIQDNELMLSPRQ